MTIFVVCDCFDASVVIMAAIRSHMYIFGSLHARAKSRDREIVGARKRVSEGHLKTTSNIMWCGHGPSSVV